MFGNGASVLEFSSWTFIYTICENETKIWSEVVNQKTCSIPLMYDNKVYEIRVKYTYMYREKEEPKIASPREVVPFLDIF